MGRDEESCDSIAKSFFPICSRDVTLKLRITTFHARKTRVEDRWKSDNSKLQQEEIPDVSLRDSSPRS